MKMILTVFIALAIAFSGCSHTMNSANTTKDIASQQKTVVFRQRVEGFLERGRQGPDSRPLLIRPGKDVGIYRAKSSLGGIDTVTDTIQTGQELRRQRQVDVAGCIRGAEF